MSSPITRPSARAPSSFKQTERLPWPCQSVQSFIPPCRTSHASAPPPFLSILVASAAPVCGDLRRRGDHHPHGRHGLQPQQPAGRARRRSPRRIPDLGGDDLADRRRGQRRPQLHEYRDGRDRSQRSHARPEGAARALQLSHPSQRRPSSRDARLQPAVARQQPLDGLRPRRAEGDPQARRQVAGASVWRSPPASA